MKVSIIIPTHNEENFLPACLDAIDTAASRSSHEVERIVVLNRCTDATEVIARDRGCRITTESAKNLSLIRNAGAAIASGEILITIDADSLMHRDAIDNVVDRLQSGKFIGGGVLLKPERYSLGIICSVLSIMPYLMFHGVSFGMFWCYKRDFDAIGGFNPEFVSVEDLDFAKRLRAYGKEQGKKFGTLIRHPITTSCRKFDEFGDWYLLRNPGFVRTVFKGHDQKAANKFWYNVRS